MRAIMICTSLLLVVLQVSCDGPRGQLEGDDAASGLELGQDADREEGVEEEGSDLDQDVQALFSARCEHGMMTHACDECRYEVGVAKAPRRLFDEGLLRMGTVERHDVEMPVSLTGEVSFDEGRVARLRPAASGVVRRMHVELGDRVEQGQVLLELESAEASEAQEQFLEAEALLRLASSEFERVQEMHRQSITSEKEFLSARQRHELARIRVSTTQGRLTSFGLDAKDTRALGPDDPHGRILLRSPVAGTVLTLSTVAGESVQPEDPVVTVGDSSELWVWCNVYERDIAAFLQMSRSSSPRAVVSVGAWPGVEFVGRVGFVSPSMDIGTRTARIRVDIGNEDGQLMAGMFAKVDVHVTSGRSVLALPRKAVCKDEGQAFVFVSHGEDYFVRRPVSLGRSWDDWVEVLEAPENLTEVVTDGAFLLKSDVLRSKMGAGCAD